MEQDAAIQEDVVEQEVEQLQRDVVADEIAEKVKAEREVEEVVETIEEEPEEEPEIKPETNVELKVDGEVVIKTQEEVDAAGGVAEIQKSLTADKRLQQASEERQRINAEREQLRLDQEQLLVKQQELAKIDQQEQKETLNTDIEEALRAQAEATYSGDVDELVKANRKLYELQHPVQQVAPQPTLDKADIDAAVKQQLESAARSASIDEGKAAFAAEYAEISSNPELYAQANQRTIELSKQHPDWSPRQIIMEAGSQTKSWLENLVGKTQETVLEKQVENKRNKARLPTAQARKAGVAEYKPKTQAEIFAEQKAARSK